MHSLAPRLLLTTALLSALPALAADTLVLPPVHTELKRDGTVLPYRQLNEVLTKLRLHGRNLFRMDFRVDPERTKVPLADVRIAVRTDDKDYPLSIDPQGLIQLPILPEAEAKTADFATNTPKGHLKAKISLELNLAPEQLTMGKVREIVALGRTLREELLPWAVRWLVPSIEGVRVCSPTPTWELEWPEGSQLMGLALPVTAGERDAQDANSPRPRPCALLTGQESWPDSARLLPPENTHLSVKLRGN